jgi:hypothetical protein
LCDVYDFYLVVQGVGFGVVGTVGKGERACKGHSYFKKDTRVGGWVVASLQSIRVNQKVRSQAKPSQAKPSQAKRCNAIHGWIEIDRLDESDPAVQLLFFSCGSERVGYYYYYT